MVRFSKALRELVTGASDKDEMVFSLEPPVSCPRKGRVDTEAEASTQIERSRCLTCEGTGWLREPPYGDRTDLVNIQILAFGSSSHRFSCTTT